MFRIECGGSGHGNDAKEVSGYKDRQGSGRLRKKGG